MNVQYISNQKGQRTAVIVPTKEELLADIKEALQEVKLSKEGKIKLKSAWDLLNEL